MSRIARAVAVVQRPRTRRAGGGGGANGAVSGGGLFVRRLAATPLTGRPIPWSEWLAPGAKACVGQDPFWASYSKTKWLFNCRLIPDRETIMMPFSSQFAESASASAL